MELNKIIESFVDLLQLDSILEYFKLVKGDILIVSQAFCYVSFEYLNVLVVVLQLFNTRSYFFSLLAVQKQQNLVSKLGRLHHYREVIGYPP